MRELTEEEISQYTASVNENGFAIMEGAIDEGLCKDISDELERLNDTCVLKCPSSVRRAHTKSVDRA
jgi:hypothetical protein